jgi:membrane protein
VVPLFTVVALLGGNDVAHGIATVMGLNAKATADVESFLVPSHTTLTTLGVGGAIWCVLGGLAIASTMREWYERVYDQPPPTGALKTVASNGLWAVVFLVAQWVTVVIARDVKGHVLSYALQFMLAVLVWWWSAYHFLRGGVGWRQTLPTGVATAFCLTGLVVFSRLFFSGSIISGEQDYGPEGVLTGLLSFIIGFGVCIHIGAVFGRMWSERHAPKPTRSPVSDQESHQPAF